MTALKTLPRRLSSRRKKKIKMTEEEMNYILENTEIEKQDLEAKYQTFLSTHAYGQMSKRSFSRMMKECYPGMRTEKLTRHVFRMYDTNGDGCVDFKEFIIGLNIMNNGTPEQNLKQLFRILDINNDGRILTAELVEVVKDILEVLTEENPHYAKDTLTLAEAAFAEMDLNVDGEITGDEFVTACLEKKRFSKILTLLIIELFSN